MKVSERIAELRKGLNMPGISHANRVLLSFDITMLEVDIVVALQERSVRSYHEGHTDGYNQRKAGF